MEKFSSFRNISCFFLKYVDLCNCEDEGNKAKCFHETFFSFRKAQGGRLMSYLSKYCFIKSMLLKSSVKNGFQ